jgi:hypothetical protein
MRKRELSKLVSVAGRILLAYALIFPQSALAGQNQKAKDKANSPQQTTAPQAGEKQQFSAATTVKAQPEGSQGEPPESSVGQERTSSNGLHQSIKVHGHWTIEVRNPDGTLATRREFENAYSPGNFLASILARSGSVGTWAVTLVGGGVTPPCVSSGLPVNCTINEVGSPVNPGAPDFATLTLSTNLGALVLSGNATAQAAGTINSVVTVGTLCPATTPPATSCYFGTSSNFTVFNLVSGSANPPINVSLGQIIQVTVTISFS